MLGKETTGNEYRHADDGPDAGLVQLFSRPRPVGHLLAGMRALGFSADAVQTMTGAKSRDVVYAWAAGRSKPSSEAAQKLDDARRILHFICRHRELGPDSAWMLFNGKFGDMNEAGPTVIEMVARGEAPAVIRNLTSLVDGEGGGDGGRGDGDVPIEPSPPSDRRPASAVK